MRDDEDRLAGTADEWLNEAAETGANGDIRIPVAAFNRLHRAVKSRVIRLALKRVAGTLRRVDAGHMDAVLGVAAGSRPQARLDLPNDTTLTRTYGRLVFASFSEAVPIDFSYTIDGPGIFRLEAIQRSITLAGDPAESRISNESTSRTALLDRDRIAFPLTVRNFRPGDRFVPLGMTGHKKVKDFFIDLKVPAPDRRRTPILIQGKDIVWVCGFRIDNRFKVTRDTRRVLRVTLDE
jgi:tRNA(Ile)-lysidine synthase